VVSEITLGNALETKIDSCEGDGIVQAFHPLVEWVAAIPQKMDLRLALACNWRLSPSVFFNSHSSYHSDVFQGNGDEPAPEGRSGLETGAAIDGGAPGSLFLDFLILAAPLRAFRRLCSLPFFVSKNNLKR
jgi:hypothetical protein